MDEGKDAPLTIGGSKVHFAMSGVPTTIPPVPKLPEDPSALVPVGMSISIGRRVFSNRWGTTEETTSAALAEEYHGGG